MAQTATKQKMKIAQVKYNADYNLICPACGSIELVSPTMTEHGPKFICGGCSVRPTLHLVSDGQNTKMFWGF